MFKNYIKTAWRNLMKSKVFSFINILGLTIGITVCMMIYLFIMNEFSFDSFHKKAAQIYVVMRGFENEGKQSRVTYVSGMYGPALLNDFSGQILQQVRVDQNDNLVTYGSKAFHEKNILDADSGFFTLFSFPLLKGDPAKVLAQPNNVVLTETIAKKYFGTVDNAMDKVITLDKKMVLKVAGIAKDVPSNSHLKFDIVVPLENYKNRSWMTEWIDNNVYTYVLLAPNTTQADIEKRLPAFRDKYMSSDMRKYGMKFSISLMPLKDMYFSTSTFDNLKHGDKAVVYIFLSIAVLILLIACINFMNLSTIRAADRSKEVGLRKVLGAIRNQLVWQFIGESVMLTTISCVASVGLLQLLMPWYNGVLGYTLTVSWNAWPIYLYLLGVIIVVGFLAGAYPALFLSAFSPIQALKGKLRMGKGGSAFRQALVVVQFSISVFLIIGTIIIYKQMGYVKNKQLGYQKDQALVIPIDNDDIYNHKKAFKTDLVNQSAVQSVSMMSGQPGGFFDGYTFDVEGHSERWNARTEYCDFDYVKTLGLKMIAGRNFSAQFPTDTLQAAILNKTAAAKLGWTPDQAIGKWIKNTIRDSLKRRVVGVVADFNFESLKQEIAPLVIAPGNDQRVIVVKLGAGHITEGINLVKKEYASQVSGYPLEYKFLDQQFNDMYQADLRQQTIMSVFAGLAIFVACLGLFGLASFTATKRFKEIGVRKVLGSSAKGIVVLLTRDLLKPVFIATCISLPIGYWVLDKWLQNFAYKTALSWWVFLLAAGITFAIAIITVSLRAVKAALANPVSSLRTE